MKCWTITKHVCRFCQGRILKQDDSGKTTVRCADCGASAVGTVKAVCSCGQKLKTQRDAGFRCEVNPDHVAGVSQEIVTVYRGDK